MSPVPRITAYAASMRRRTSSAYAARRSSSARSTRVSATGVRTSFWIPRMVFRVPGPVQPASVGRSLRGRVPRPRLRALPVLTQGPFLERDPERVNAYVAAGYWTDETLGSMLRGRLTECPDLPFVVHSAVRPFRGTFADVDGLALRIASGLLAHGVKPGEPVAFQLPSWLEAAATWCAITYVGAIAVPIVHFYGAKEVGFILQQSRARIHVTVDRFGHVDMLGNLEQMRPSL